MEEEDICSDRQWKEKRSSGREEEGRGGGRERLKKTNG